MPFETPLTPQEIEAGNPETTLKRLQELSTDPHLTPLIAANPSAPSDLLERLAKSEQEEVRRAVTGNPNTPLHQKEIMGLAVEFPEEFLANPIVPLLKLSHPEFYKKLPSDAWYQILRCEGGASLWPKLMSTKVATPPRNLTRLETMINMHISVAGEAGPGWRAEIEPMIQEYQAGEFRVPTDVLVSLLATRPDLTKFWRNRLHLIPVDQRPAIAGFFPEDEGEAISDAGMVRLEKERAQHALHVRLEKEKTLHIQRDLALYPELEQMSSEELEDFAYNCDPGLQELIARLPQASPELLTRLARIKNVSTSQAVAANVSTPISILYELFNSSHREKYYQALIANPNTPLEIFEQMLAVRLTTRSYGEAINLMNRLKDHPAVLRDRRRVILNYALNLLKRQVMTPLTIGSRYLLLENPELPLPILEIFARSSMWEERYLVTQHPQSPKEVIEKLSHDGNRYVRAGAQESLKDH